MLPGEEERNEGMRRADNAAPQWWKDQAYETIAAIASAQDTLTADDVFEAGLPYWRENRAIGPVFARAQRAGLIRKAAVSDQIEQFIPSKRPELHRTPIQVWRSLTRAVATA